jgi:ketosteroid isomerase-like protein
MPDWLIEGDLTLLILIGFAAGLCAYIWSKTRKRLWLGLAIAGVAFLGLLVLLDHWFESDREQITSNIKSMAAAVPRHDFNTIFSHFASDFRYGAVDKAEFRRHCETIGKSRNVREMIVWSIQLPKGDQPKDNAFTLVTFQFKIKADALAEESFFLCSSQWVKERDGRWRLRTFRVYPLSGADQPIVIPGIG